MNPEFAFEFCLIRPQAFYCFMFLLINSATTELQLEQNCSCPFYNYAGYTEHLRHYWATARIVHVFVCVSVCVRAHARVCVRVCVCANVRVSMCVCV